MLTSSNGVESKHFPLPQLCPVHHLRSSGKHPGNARRTRVVSTFPANRLHQRYSRESMRGDECTAATTSLLIYLFCGCCNSPMKSRPFWKSLAWRVYTCVAVRSLMPPARRPTGESIYERVVFYAAKLRPNLCCFPSRMTTFIIGTDLTCFSAGAKLVTRRSLSTWQRAWYTSLTCPGTHSSDCQYLFSSMLCVFTYVRNLAARQSATICAQ